MLGRLRVEWSQSRRLRRKDGREKSPAEFLIFFIIFLVGFFLLLIHTFSWVIPQWKTVQEYVPGECTVLETRIQSREGTEEGKETLYRPEVRISLIVEQVPYIIWTYEANTLSAEAGFSFDRDSAGEILESFEIGKAYPCWYPPRNPEKAVLKRESSLWGWFFLVIPLCLIAFGIGGITQSIRFFSISEERRAAQIANKERAAGISPGSHFARFYPTVPDPKQINDSPGTFLAFRLPILSAPSIRLFILFFFASLWNAIAWSVLVGSLYHSSGAFHEIAFSIIFGLLFCGFGLVLIIGILHGLLTAFGIGPTILEISDHPLYPDRKYRLMLQQSGTLRFRRLEIGLVCEEIARFRQGTDTITSRKDVFSQNLFSKEDFETTREKPFQEEFFIRLPLGAMHSMRLEHNEILWKIVLHAQIIGWSDLLFECPIIVNPVSITERPIE